MDDKTKAKLVSRTRIYANNLMAMEFWNANLGYI